MTPATLQWETGAGSIVTDVRVTSGSSEKDATAHVGTRSAAGSDDLRDVVAQPITDTASTAAPNAPCHGNREAFHVIACTISY